MRCDAAMMKACRNWQIRLCGRSEAQSRRHLSRWTYGPLLFNGECGRICSRLNLVEFVLIRMWPGRFAAPPPSGQWRAPVQPIQWRL